VRCNYRDYDGVTRQIERTDYTKWAGFSMAPGSPGTNGSAGPAGRPDRPGPGQLPLPETDYRHGSCVRSRPSLIKTVRSVLSNICAYAARPR
jgi:hypothetical protein